MTGWTTLVGPDMVMIKTAIGSSQGYQWKFIIISPQHGPGSLGTYIMALILFGDLTDPCCEKLAHKIGRLKSENYWMSLYYVVSCVGSVSCPPNFTYNTPATPLRL